jgi:hypothetical protein
VILTFLLLAYEELYAADLIAYEGGCVFYMQVKQDMYKEDLFCKGL